MGDTTTARQIAGQPHRRVRVTRAVVTALVHHAAFLAAPRVDAPLDGIGPLAGAEHQRTRPAAKGAQLVGHVADPVLLGAPVQPVVEPLCGPAPLAGTQDYLGALFGRVLRPGVQAEGNQRAQVTDERIAILVGAVRQHRLRGAAHPDSAPPAGGHDLAELAELVVELGQAVEPGADAAGEPVLADEATRQVVVAAAAEVGTGQGVAGAVRVPAMREDTCGGHSLRTH